MWWVFAQYYWAILWAIGHVGVYGGSLLALSVQHVLECIVMAGIQRTKLSDSFTTFDTIKPIYFTAALICSDALPILGVISAVTFIIRVQNK